MSVHETPTELLRTTDSVSAVPAVVGLEATPFDGVLRLQHPSTISIIYKNKLIEIL